MRSGAEIFSYIEHFIVIFDLVHRSVRVYCFPDQIPDIRDELISCVINSEMLQSNIRKHWRIYVRERLDAVHGPVFSLKCSWWILFQLSGWQSFLLLTLHQIISLLNNQQSFLSEGGEWKYPLWQLRRKGPPLRPFPFVKYTKRELISKGALKRTWREKDLLR